MVQGRNHAQAGGILLVFLGKTPISDNLQFLICLPCKVTQSVATGCHLASWPDKDNLLQSSSNSPSLQPPLLDRGTDLHPLSVPTASSLTCSFLASQHARFLLSGKDQKQTQSGTRQLIRLQPGAWGAAAACMY